MSKLAIAYIGLGSNLNQPKDQLTQALASLERLAGVKLMDCSPWYQSRPVGPDNQPDYINAVALLNTALAPEALLHELQAIENQQGRVRDIRWGARTLDLDLLLYDDVIQQSAFLTLPHPEMSRRDFVLKPLSDLAPDLCLPTGESVVALLKDCDDNQLILLE